MKALAVTLALAAALAGCTYVTVNIVSDVHVFTSASNNGSDQ
jgi:hypothetical protein